MATSYRADQVGSLLRPAAVLEARADHAEGRIGPEQLRNIEDKAILDALELQRQVGIDVFTDGEYRRGDFRTDFAEAVEGMSPVGFPLKWRGPQADTLETPTAWVVAARLQQKRRLTAHESSFVKEHAPGPYKVTIPSAGFMAPRCYRAGITDRVYPRLSDLLREMSAIVRSEVRALAAEGVPYIQLDAPGYTAFIDQQQRQDMRDRGVDPDKTFGDVVEADKSSLEGLEREGLTLAIHLCRGNNRSHWLGEGSYEPIAEKLFTSLPVDTFLLEYDTERAGGFEPLRFVPRGKTVVLGLITTKEGRLESRDLLLRRIDEAARYVPIEDLAISPQCGFASVNTGNLLSWDDQRRKLELVVEIARRVWG